MKKTKLYAKKTLSIFMAAVMLMTAWVFVAPEKASAAADVAPVTTYASYDVTVTADFDGAGSGGSIEILYYPVDSNGNLVTSSPGSYVLVNSIAYYNSSDIFTFKTADDSTRRLSTDTSAETGKVQGWPYGFRIKANSGATVYFREMWIEGVNAVKYGQWGIKGLGSKEMKYDQDADYFALWTEPKVDTITCSPSSATINVPKGSSGTSNISATVKDQYGVKWPSSNGLTANLGITNGASVSLSGNTATVTGNSNVFNNSGYNSSNGQIKTTLQMIQGGKTASCDVVFQSPKYNVYLQNFAGNTVKTYTDIGYYNQSVTLTDLPSNTGATPCEGTDKDKFHDTYVWPDGVILKGDQTVREVKASPAESHTFGDPVNKDANYHTTTCGECGYVKEIAHQWNDGVVTTEPTCEGTGIKTFTCSGCGATTTETVPVKGHSFTSGIYAEKEAGENGTHYQKCIRCDAYGMGVTVGNCEAHKWVEDSRVDAECEKDGSITYKCTVCGSTSYVKTIGMTGHESVRAVAAKNIADVCGEIGWPAFWICDDCGKAWLDEGKTNEIADPSDNGGATGVPDSIEKTNKHVFDGNYVSASTGKDGKHYRACSICGKAYGLDGVEGATEPHDWDDGKVTTEPTCEKEGVKTYKCNLCPQTYTESISKISHEMTKTDAKPATCLDKGNNEYYYCSICKKNYKDEAGTAETTVEAETVKALGHTFAAGNTDEEHPESDARVSAATCMTPAVYKVTCDRCNAASDRTYEYGDPDTVNGHKFDGETRKNEDGTHSYKCTVEGCDAYGNATTCDYKVTKDVASTCHTYGYTITKCATCGKENRVEKTELDLDNHDGGTEVREVIAATCAANGFTGNTYCLGCRAKIANGETIPADKTKYPHEDMKIYDAQPSTCQTEGWKEYKYCSACGTYEIAKETIAKKAHKFTTYTSNNDGTHTAICDTCDAAVATLATDTKNCEGGTANCVNKKVCDVCESVYGDVDSTNHKTVKTAPEIKSTCQTEGTEAYRYCEACSKNIDEIKKTEKLPHVYDKWTSNGDGTHSKTCTLCDPVVATPDKQTENCNGGIAYCNKLAKCADCKAEYGELNSANHSTEANTLKDVVAATCQAEGFSGNYRYNCCDAIKEAGKVTEKLAHTFDIEVEGSRVAATCIAKGEVTYKCSTCVETDDVKAATEKKELPIDAKNHATPEETVIKNKKAATCESDGHTGDVYYKCCYVEGATAEDNRKALKEKGTTIKANGQHVYGDPIPEYMIAEIKEIKDADGNVTGKEIVLKTEEPDYDAKIKARREDSKWYHAQQCTICGEIVYDACFTYAHTYNCKETDICEICEGLCSLIDENKHTNLIEIPEVPATPTTDGTKAYYKCADCGKFFLDDAGKKGFDPTSEEGKKLITISKETADCDHDWPDTPNQTVEPACGEAGYKLFVCTICGDEKKEEIPATSDSHKWSETYKVTKEPTCGSVGYEALYCTECGKFKPNSTVTIAATGKHTYKLTATHPGTSCTDPTVETYECDVCGKTKTETVYDGAAAHEWGEWVNKGGSCASGVILERSCNKCSAKEQKKEENNDHSYEVIVRVNPTCEEDGYQIEKCKNCGIENRTELPKDPDAPEHVINENKYKTVEKATCEAAEQREYVCLLCGEKVIRFVGEPLDHVWLLQPAEIATCTRPGHREYYRCVRCEQPYDDGKGEIVIEQLKHEDGDGDGKCDECNSKLYNAGESNCGCMCHKEGWLMKLIYKILNFFWKLFKINPSCDCGATHY